MARKKQNKVLVAVRKMVATEIDVSTMGDAASKIGLPKMALYDFRSGGTVSVKNLHKISEYFQISYADVIWEYRQNFNDRLDRPGHQIKPIDDTLDTYLGINK